MNKYKNRKIFTVFTALLLAFGCSCSSGEIMNFSSSVGFEKNENVLLSIYCDDAYKNAIDRVIHLTDLNYSNIDFTVSQDKSSADIVISKCLYSDEMKNKMPLNDFADRNIFPEDLIYFDDEKIIGIPIFMEISGFWCDSLFYERNALKLPYSLTDIESSVKNTGVPAVCNANDPEVLFWSVVAPLYLNFGGTVRELESGTLNKAALNLSLNRLDKLFKSGVLKKSENSDKDFYSLNSVGYFCSFNNIVSLENSLPTLSDLCFAPYIIYNNNSEKNIIIRSGTLTVKDTVDKKLISSFLSVFLDDNTLSSIAASNHLPLACKVTYGSRTVPNNLQKLYSTISSPFVKAINITCHWSKDVTEEIYGGINEIL